MSNLTLERVREMLDEREAARLSVTDTYLSDASFSRIAPALARLVLELAEELREWNDCAVESNLIGYATIQVPQVVRISTADLLARLDGEQSAKPKGGE